MDIWHILGRIFRASNLGTFAFFALNTALLCAIFVPSGVPVWFLVICYAITVLISLSPVGEWTLALLAGAREIRRKDIQIRLIPLLEIVFDRAKAKTPSMVNFVRLKIIHNPSPNAFAIGRRTICVTDGLLDLSDDEIMAIFAHEIGHIAYHHSTIQLLIGGGNIFISGCLLLIKAICWVFTAVFGFVAGIASNSFLAGVLAAMAASLSAGLIWLWTKFCALFLMWSLRQNEYVADEYAYSLGFGNTLASILDRQEYRAPSGLLGALYSAHPDNHNRIAHLQSLGASYSRY